MRRWLFALVAVAVAALVVWQWRAAEPLDLTDAAVRESLSWGAGLGPIDITVEPAVVLPNTRTSVIGHWEYTAKVLGHDGPDALVPETGANRIAHGGPSTSPPGNLFQRINAPREVEVRKRPLTLVARIRAALGAD